MVDKKVLYVDPMCYKAHSYYNKRNVEILSTLCDLDVLFLENYLDLSDTDVKNVLNFKTRRGCFSEYIRSRFYFGKRIKEKVGMFKILREIKRVAKKGKYDLVLFSGCDIVAFSLSMRHTKQNMAVIHHGIFRALESKLVMRQLTHTNPRITFVVFEEYIKEFLKDTLKIKNDTKVLHHPICNDTLGDNNALIGPTAIELFAPSHANSLKMITEVAERLNKNEANVFLCARGAEDYSTEHIKIYSKQFLSREEYAKRFAEADFILIPYDEHYNYRVSGVLFDALARKKLVLLMLGNTLEYYADKYPSAILPISSVDELIGRVTALTKDEIREMYNDKFISDCERFMADYSDEVLRGEFAELLNERGESYDNH